MTTPSDTSSPSVERPFLVRGSDGRLIQSPGLFVKWRELHRVTGRLGEFNVVESAGWDHKEVSVRTARADDSHDPRIVNAYGMTTTIIGKTVPLSSSELHKIVRRIKPDDHAAIADVDERIADLEAQIKELRVERKSIVQRAWKRGVQVWVDEVRPSDDTPSGARFVVE